MKKTAADEASASWICKLFEAQDAVAKANFASSSLIRDSVSLLSDSCQLTLRIFSNSFFSDPKESALDLFVWDCLSHTVLAARLGLSGNVAAAVSLLRCAVESSAQLELVVSKGRYQTALQEFKNQKFVHVSYKAAFRELGKRGSQIERLWGLMSESATHATPSRVGFAFFEISGQRVPSLGFSPVIAYGEFVLFYCLHPCKSVLDSLQAAGKSEKEEFRWAKEIGELRIRLNKLRTKFRQQTEEFKKHGLSFRN